MFVFGQLQNGDETKSYILTSHNHKKIVYIWSKPFLKLFPCYKTANSTCSIATLPKIVLLIELNMYW